MELRFSHHAASQMSQRKLLAEWVIWTIAAPEFVRDDEMDYEVKLAFRRIMEFGNRYLCTASKPDARPVFVVTAFVDRNAEKKR